MLDNMVACIGQSQCENTSNVLLATLRELHHSETWTSRSPEIGFRGYFYAINSQTSIGESLSILDKSTDRDAIIRVSNLLGDHTAILYAKNTYYLWTRNIPLYYVHCLGQYFVFPVRDHWQTAINRLHLNIFISDEPQTFTDQLWSIGNDLTSTNIAMPPIVKASTRNFGDVIRNKLANNPELAKAVKKVSLFEDIAQQIKDLRLKANLTLDALAKLTKMHPTTIERVENGEEHSLWLTSEIAKALNCQLKVDLRELSTDPVGIWESDDGCIARITKIDDKYSMTGAKSYDGIYEIKDNQLVMQWSFHLNNNTSLYAWEISPNQLTMHLANHRFTMKRLILA